MHRTHHTPKADQALSYAVNILTAEIAHMCGDLSCDCEWSKIWIYNPVFFFIKCCRKESRDHIGLQPPFARVAQQLEAVQCEVLPPARSAVTLDTEMWWWV